MAGEGVLVAIETYIPNYQRMSTWAAKTFCDTLAVFCGRETSDFQLCIESKVFLVKLKRNKSELVSNFLIELFLQCKISDFVHSLLCS